MTTRTASDQALVARALVTVRFSRPQEFVAELQARGPTLEPLVRCTEFLRPRRVGRFLSGQELVVHASYLRRTDTVVHLVVLEWVAGTWNGAAELDAQTEQRAAQVRDLICAAAVGAGLDVAPGRYATPSGR